MFDTLTLDREACDWTSHLRDLSPVQQHGGTWLKREDLFAPLGEGGINGSKLRGCIFMMNRRHEAGQELIFTGASIKSPQHSMTAAVARHLGQETIHVIGATKEDTAIKAVQVQMAAWFGARFDIINIGYNGMLQARVKDLQQAAGMGSGTMPYGISPSNSEMVEFHDLGGFQVQNLPDVDTLVIPAGSCNTLASILYGLHKYDRPTSLKRIVTVAIGPSRQDWTRDRLIALEAVAGYRLSITEPAKALARRPTPKNYIEIIHLDPHGEGFCTYQDDMRESIGDVVLHPTYEGKVRRYLNKHYPDLLDDRACLWIVGGPAKLQSMWDACSGELGTPPSRLPMVGGA